MAHAEIPPSDPAGSPAQHAVRVLEITRRAWQLAPRTARALARRASYGYVPRRAQLRALALAHAW